MCLMNLYYERQKSAHTQVVLSRSQVFLGKIDSYYVTSFLGGE